ncbi:hypothetical protein FE257_005321 [Aspergillus nanangensis]|uniref:Calcineurin-like phosphoesterase domain-containing protein n=1 Tax=Aspergillus nanangensis TaxID=2582783 RepID=A0AAD4CBC9_ASPNN|nr:hypothetical protein FE257_005321 [Aspergillus nanangensis]
MLRKTRFVCVSDTHAYTPSEAGFKLPAGDVLIHAGDLTNHGSISELRKTMNWIAAADFEVKIVVCGNHDVTLDQSFYASYGRTFHSGALEDPQECIKVVVEASSSIVFLQHQSALVRLTRPHGPNTMFKVFGSPYSQSHGTWAFGYEDADAAALWGAIPLDADVVVTHTPPYTLCDSRPGGSVGCNALRQVLSRVRPLLEVCGHIHESRGCERVRWPPHSSPTLMSGIGIKSNEDKNNEQIERVALPSRGSKKQSLVDLTGKRAQRLDNDGYALANLQLSLATLFKSSRENIFLLPPMTTDIWGIADTHAREVLRSTSFSSEVSDGNKNIGIKGAVQLHRQETCVVNAAILATSWPHRGGKRFNAPIVVDIDLPVWTRNG